MNEASVTGKPTRLYHALRLRCPHCGLSKLQKKSSWFQFEEACLVCHYRYEREPGYYTNASWMLNLPITSTLAFLLSIVLYLSDLGLNAQLIAAAASVFVLGFGAWFFPYSQALWLYLEHKWNPLNADDEFHLKNHHE